jgi:hypothetical protein
MNSLKYISVTVGILLLTGVSTAFAQGPHFSDWSAPTNVTPINTPATDGCPFIAKDELSLYFASTDRVPRVFWTFTFQSAPKETIPGDHPGASVSLSIAVRTTFARR